MCVIVWQGAALFYPGHVEIEARHGAESSTHHGGLGGDDTERGQDTEVCMILIQELEVVRLLGGHAHTQGIENALDVGVGKGGLWKSLAHRIHLTGGELSQELPIFNQDSSANKHRTERSSGRNKWPN